ncbi:hypothetical protein HDU92_008738 [Lobulomyces angularis]|nr:hypothetical protein HDU92_008738 [Lobulomyces angularis]
MQIFQKLREEELSIKEETLAKNVDVCSILNLIKELEQIGYQNIFELEKDLNSFKLSYKANFLKVEPFNFLISHNLPLKNKTFVYMQNNLFNVFMDFKKLVDNLEPFWETFKNFERETWVLEPEEPIPKDITFRRIAFAKNLTLTIEILDPFRPLCLPKFKIFGDEKLSTEYRSLIQGNLTKWNELKPLKENIEYLISEKLPKKPNLSSEKEVHKFSCGICYLFKFEDKTPEINCENCFKSYHSCCLEEWLRGLNTTRFVFRTLIGECIFCHNSLSVCLD